MEDPSIQLIDASDVGIARFDRQGHCVLCNPALARLLGKEPAQLAGIAIHALLPGIVGAPDRSASHTSGGQSFRLRLQRQEERKLQALLMPLGSGETLSTLLDITARRQAEGAPASADRRGAAGHRPRTPAQLE